MHEVVLSGQTYVISSPLESHRVSHPESRRSMMACSRIRRALPVFVGIVLLAAPVAGQMVPKLDSYQGVAVRILQSNNAGTTHHIIDPTTQKVVGVIHGCPHAHNLTTHPDGLYYYCANEQESTVDVFDTKTLQKVTSIKLSARPNKI